MTTPPTASACSGAPLLSAIDIIDLTFSHNGIVASGPSVNRSGDISLFNFLGNALIKNVTVHGGDSPVSSTSNANFGIQVAGYNPSTHDITHAIGNVVFDNVSVTGAYSKLLLFVQGYTDLDGLTFLSTGTNLNGSAGWGVAAQIDPTTGSLIDFNAAAAAALAPNVVDLSHLTAVNNIPFASIDPSHPSFAYNGWRWPRCFPARRSPTTSSAPPGRTSCSAAPATTRSTAAPAPTP